MFEEFTIGPFGFTLKDRSAEEYTLVGCMGGQVLLDDAVDKKHDLKAIKLRCKQWCATQLIKWRQKVDEYRI